MSDKHPHINAAGMAADITTSFHNHLRGAAKDNLEAAFEIFGPMVVEFLNKLSSELDKKFGN